MPTKFMLRAARKCIVMCRLVTERCRRKNFLRVSDRQTKKSDQREISEKSEPKISERSVTDRWRAAMMMNEKCNDD